ncbi:hypothetical protein FHS16_001753 [Paenibacillus endophyticus]|uniref:Replication protein n=1 Tax=Paenibacillus endophyticus TaxID=1294268 RepID=A0A7W5GA86_9BACL|nr:hypothetical protein [Paenibacillus endophyticus]MBB3151707.1 hypothetical protein [Paenibacillus endophyticus]
MAKKRKDFGFKQFETDVRSADKHHIRITRSMMSTGAWKTLTVHSKVLYIEMKNKYTGSNENDISFTYKEAAEIMNARTFTKSVDQLIEYGFIKLIEQNWTTRRPNIYGFNDQWKLFASGKQDVKLRKKRAPPN